VNGWISLTIHIFQQGAKVGREKSEPYLISVNEKRGKGERRRRKVGKPTYTHKSPPFINTEKKN